MRSSLAAICAGIFLLLCDTAAAQDEPRAAPTTAVVMHALAPLPSPQAGFDAERSTNAYLSEDRGAERARSDSYFEGGYVLLVVHALYAIIISGILLWLRISAGMRDFARAITRSRFWQVPIYVALYTLLAAALTFPLTIYAQFFREQAYGLSNQTLLHWLGDFGIGLGLNIVSFIILLTIIYAIIRRAPGTWWAWGTLVSIGYLIVAITVAPVFVEPLYNHYQPLRDGPLKTDILSLARSEGVPASDVFEFDASRQSRRVSANVSGLFGTTRVSLSDNLLKRGTHDEIIAVLGHEIGHYVLDHKAIDITWLGLVFLAGFTFVNWGSKAAFDIFGGNWDVRSIDDPAGLPALTALFAVFMLVATPFTNTISRTTEAQADIFGLNAARKPDGFARAVLMIGEYRKLEPSPLEEFMFFNHPSGRSRISMAMRWKAEHLNDFDIRSGPVSPK